MKNNLIRLVVLLTMLYILDFIVLANIIVASTIISEIFIKLIGKESDK